MMKTIQSKTIYNPTEFQYIQLQEESSQSLSCPCTSISMLYSHFLTIEPQYHQVCSSDLVSDRWIEYLHDAFTSRSNSLTEDFRDNGGDQFKLLSIFCRQSQQIITDSLRLFFQTKYFTSQIISQQSFQIQINSSFQDWKSTTIKTFLTTIQLFQATIHGNRLINNLNFGILFDRYSGAFIMSPRTYSNCDCGVSPLCQQSANLYEYDEILNA
ncbi:hypothetical protein I4U23_016184 [Adineta vaga]|nr:hypothetical protein I4U23_016184 [Adineta vaga]